MALIELEHVTKRFGSVVAVDRLDLAVGAGEFLTLLGPSGCGKTTVLRMVAGLEIPDEGTIRIEGKTVFSSREGVFVPPGKRNIGLVFQSYALWPHMTVFENVAFGLQVRGTDRKTVVARVAEALAYMQLQGMEKRAPQQLSGGQQQRVALARMLVTKPSIFLMDEPLSNLDAKLRMEMRAEIKRLHRETKATTVYVTHDQHEALTMSSRIAVMDRGILQQVAPPQETYRRPANLFVADFIGSPTINFLSGRVARDGDRLLFRGEAMTLPLTPPGRLEGRKVTAAIRPEDIRFVANDREGEEAVIDSVLPAGADVIVQVRKGSCRLTVKAAGDFAGDVGDPVYLFIPPEAVHLYEKETGRLCTEPVGSPGEDAWAGGTP